MGFFDALNPLAALGGGGGTKLTGPGAHENTNVSTNTSTNYATNNTNQGTTNEVNLLGATGPITISDPGAIAAAQAIATHTVDVATQSLTSALKTTSDVFGQAFEFANTAQKGPQGQTNTTVLWAALGIGALVVIGIWAYKS